MGDAAFAIQRTVVRIVLRAYVVFASLFVWVTLVGPGTHNSVALLGALLVAALCWLMQYKRRAPVILGSAAMLCGLAIMLTAVARGDAWPASLIDFTSQGAQQPEPQRWRLTTSLDDLKAGGGAPFLASIACGAFALHAGIFLCLSSVRNSFFQQDKPIIHVDGKKIGFLLFVAILLLPLISLAVISFPMMGLQSREIVSNPAALAASAGWRLVTALTVFLTSIGVFFMARAIWWGLKTIEIVDESRRSRTD